MAESVEDLRSLHMFNELISKRAKRKTSKNLFVPYDPYLQSGSEVFGVDEVLESSSPFLQIRDRKKKLRHI